MLKETPTGHWRILWPLMLGLTIAFVSSQPVPDAFARLMFNWDKLIHFTVFGLMGMLVARLEFVQRRLPFGAMSAILIVSLFGVSDEIHQAFTPGRCCDLSDWVADTLGATTFVTLYARWTAWRSWLEHRVVIINEERRVRVVLPGLPPLLPA